MTMEDEREVMDGVARALGRMKKDGDSVLVTTHKGVVLRCRSVAPRYMGALEEQFPTPTPPTVHIPEQRDPETGNITPGWDEENPNDPAWKREVEAVTNRKNEAFMRLLLGLGTTVESIPDSVFPPESDDWIAVVRRAEKFTGVEVPIDVSDEDMRYISWLYFYVLDNNADLALAGLLPQWLAGVSEVEIANGLEAFWRLSQRGTYPDLSAIAAGTNGNRPNRADRRGSKSV